MTSNHIVLITCFNLIENNQNNEEKKHTHKTHTEMKKKTT